MTALWVEHTFDIGMPVDANSVCFLSNSLCIFEKRLNLYVTYRKKKTEVIYCYNLKALWATFLKFLFYPPYIMIDFATFSLNVRQLHLVEYISFTFTVKKFQHELGEILLIVIYEVWKYFHSFVYEYLNQST